jgi:hypothetical protein
MKPDGRRWRPLAALTVAVLALHGLALHGGPPAWQPAPGPSAAVMRVRAVPPPDPVSEPNRPAARTNQAQTAIKMRAPERPRPPAQDFAVPAPPPQEASLSPAPAAPEPPAATAALPVEPPPTALAVPGSRRLRYEVQAQYRGFTVPGQAELLWRHDGSSYEARLEISSPLLPARLQRSTGRITAQGLAPQRFSDRTRSEEAAHFDREAAQVVFSTNRPPVALQPGAQDRLSVLLQLGALLAGAPAQFPAGTTLSIQTAGTREAEVWAFVVEGDEELALPGGTLRGLKLTRGPRKEFDQKVELWLAPGMDYAPARLRLTQPNGDWLDLQWSATDRG